MERPKAYYIQGSVCAKDKHHLFRDIFAGCEIDLNRLNPNIDWTIIGPSEMDDDGVYYLKNEGAGNDYGQSYLIAKGNVGASEIGNQNGSISITYSPYRSLENFKIGIQGIQKLLDEHARFEEETSKVLLKLLYTGVFSEVEGYLATTLIAIVQGDKDVYKEACELFETNNPKIIEDALNRSYYIRLMDIYKKDINTHNDGDYLYRRLLSIKTEKIKRFEKDVQFRNELTHSKAIRKYNLYPTHTDVCRLIKECSELVNYIDEAISPYKTSWIKDLQSLTV